MSTPRREPGFAGEWHTTFGKLSIRRVRGGLDGTYEHKGGRLRGAQDDGVLRGIWIETEHLKEGVFELALTDGGNAFRGSWRGKDDAVWQGEWTGVRLELPPEEEGGSPFGWNAHEEGPLGSGPMVGEVGETEARVWAQARDGAPLSLRLFGPGGEEIERAAEPAWSEWLCVAFHVGGLRPATTYEYRLESRHGRTERHCLRTAPPRGAPRARIAFGSCFWNFPDAENPIFDAIARESPDAFVMLGDTSYLVENDWQSEHRIMLTHLRHRNAPALRRLLPDTPVIGAWDDHDFGPGDSGGSFEGRDASMRAFRRMWPRALPAADLRGTARFGPVEIFLLDSRWHRGLGRRAGLPGPGAPDVDSIEGRTILGAEQLDWLVCALAASDAPVKIVASPTQVLPEIAVQKGWDCFRGDAPGELEALLGAIEARDVRGVVFASGDLHMANLLHVPGRAAGGRTGPELWELTASPLANDPWNEPAAGADPTIVAEVHDRTNYGVFDVDLDRPGREVLLQLRDASGAPLFEQPIDLATLRAR